MVPSYSCSPPVLPCHCLRSSCGGIRSEHVSCRWPCQWRVDPPCRVTYRHALFCRSAPSDVNSRSARRLKSARDAEDLPRLVIYFRGRLIECLCLPILFMYEILCRESLGMTPAHSLGEILGRVIGERKSSPAPRMTILNLALVTIGQATSDLLQRPMVKGEGK